jgi:hypothetical protein
MQFSEEESGFDDSEAKNDGQPSSQVREGENPMFLEYVVRKLRTEKFPNITNLKKKFGHDLLVSEIKCTWKNFTIYFDMEQTMRLINYFISQILGTVASKFKKKEYSLNYISEVLKVKKITTFDIKFNNFIVMLTPHSRLDHFFEFKVEEVNFTKNKLGQHPQYDPQLIKVDTKRGLMQFFHEVMVFEVGNVVPFYRFGAYPPEKLTKDPFDVFVTYSKLGFSREHEPILKKLEDIDRTIKVAVQVSPGFRLEMQKIVFLTLLQVYYQNIQHRDGKAERFETPHPVPPLKSYEINLGAVELYMYEYLPEGGLRREKDSKLGTPKSSSATNKKMKAF